MSTPTDLSIVIVSWNTCTLLAQCLASLEATAGDWVYDIWVVDNASGDGSVAMVRERFPRVHVLENQTNVGFAAANNQAIPQTAGSLILLLNSDTVVQPHALEEIVRFMRATPRAGIVGANVVNVDGSPQRCFGRFPTLLSETIYAWGLDAYLPIEPSIGRQNHAIPTDWVLGAALTVRRAALDQVGLLDAGYFMYSEEVDLCYRVKRAGWENFVLPSARVIHLGGESTKQTEAAMKAHLFHSKVQYLGKYHGALAARLMQGMFGASILARRLMYHSLGHQRANRLWAEVWVRYINLSKQPLFR